MPKNKKTNRAETETLEYIDSKLDLLVLLQSLQVKDKKQQVKALENYKGDLRKREIGLITGMDKIILKW